MAIPECLVNYIGIRGVCSEIALGGLWIDDMPDAGIIKFEAMAGPEFPDFKQVWDKVYRRSCETWISDIRKLLDPKIKTNPILANYNSGVFDTTLPTTASPVYSGELLTIEGSPFMEIFLESVMLLMSGADDTCLLKIWDVDTTEELYSQTISCSAGMNTVLLNLSIPVNYGRRRIFIGFNRTTWTGYKATTQGCGCAGVTNQSVPRSIPTGDISPFNFAAITNDSQNMGMVLRYGLRCSLNSFVCQNRDALNVSLRYKAFIELLAEILYNDTLTNRYTLISKDELRTRISEFGAMYQNELSGILDSVSYKSDSVCFDCNQPVQLTYIHP